jgi:hypothetical protein
MLPIMKAKHSILEGHQAPARWHLPGWELLPLFVVVAWTGCSQPGKVAVEASPSGTYALVSVDGKGVPCPLTHDGHTLLIKRGSFTFTPPGACSSKLVFSPPSGGEATREVKATYTQQGSKLTMRWEGAGMTIGTFESDTFTMNNEGMVLQYRK